MTRTKAGGRRKALQKRQAAIAKPPNPLDLYMALVDADRWLFFASLGLGDHADLLAAVEQIRRKIGKRLTRVQASAYRAWSQKIARQHSSKKKA